MSTETKAATVSYLRLAFSLALFALAAWFAVTGEARFDLGGDEFSNRRAIHVDARGLDAAVVGLVFAGVGLLNLALGLRGPARFVVLLDGGGGVGLDDDLRPRESGAGRHQLVRGLASRRRLTPAPSP